MARTITHLSVERICDMLADGFTPQDIQAENDRQAEAAFEAAAEADEYHNRYGDDYDDDSREYGTRAEYNDRLDMGRNDAGEWIGFM